MLRFFRFNLYSLFSRLKCRLFSIVGMFRLVLLGIRDTLRGFFRRRFGVSTRHSLRNWILMLLFRRLPSESRISGQLPVMTAYQRWRQNRPLRNVLVISLMRWMKRRHVSRPYLLEAVGGPVFDVGGFAALVFLIFLFVSFGKYFLRSFSLWFPTPARLFSSYAISTSTPTVVPSFLFPVSVPDSSVPTVTPVFTSTPTFVPTSVLTSTPTFVPTLIPTPTLTPTPDGYLGTYTFRYSYYYPPLGGVNCLDYRDGDCVSMTASGQDWRDWVNKGAACPSWLPFYSVIVVDYPPEISGRWVCVDRGSAIVADIIDFLMPYQVLPWLYPFSASVYHYYP